MIMALEEANPKGYARQLASRYSISNTRQQETALLTLEELWTTNSTFTPKEIASSLSQHPDSALHPLDHSDLSRILQRKERQGQIIRLRNVDEYRRPARKRGKPTGQKTDLGGRKTLYQKSPLLQGLQNVLARPHVYCALIDELEKLGILLVFFRLIAFTEIYLARYNFDIDFWRTLAFKDFGELEKAKATARLQEFRNIPDEALQQYAERIALKMQQTLCKQLGNKTSCNFYINMALGVGLTTLLLDKAERGSKWS